MVYKLIDFYVFTLWGWKVQGQLPEKHRFVAIMSPHTSNWDFIITLACYSKLNVSFKWYGKDSIFKPPTGWFMKYIGGVPIDRSKHTNVVDRAIEEYGQREDFVLAITPEGTRSATNRWKTGFYYIAKGANVPIVPISFDFPSKTMHIGEPLIPGDDIESDISKLMDFCRPHRGRFPKNEFPGLSGKMDFKD